MKKIIVHSGNAHLDDFLSCCLILNKDEDVVLIERRNPTAEDLENPEVWVVDIGEEFNPERLNFDHHQKEMEDCSLSLLLKYWEIWQIALVVHGWLETAVLIDTIGSKRVINRLGLHMSVLVMFDSFIERSILHTFQQKAKIKKGSCLFAVMKSIGKEFFRQIEEYTHLLEIFDSKTELKEINGIPAIQCLDLEFTPMLKRIMIEKKRELWGEGGLAIYRNERGEGMISVKRFDDDRRVDFRKLPTHDKKKIEFVHPSGFFAVFKNMSSEYELEQYIKGAIK